MTIILNVSDISDASDEESEVPLPSMKDWDINHVCMWISTFISDTSAAQSVFSEQQITGEILLSLQGSDYASGAFSGIPFGIFRKVQIERDKVLEAEKDGSSKPFMFSSKRNLKKPTQQIRPFGSCGIFTYSKGSRLYANKRQTTDLIQPVHYFVDMQDTENKPLKIVEEIMMFTCSCLNDRRNGTIHIGIGKSGDICGVKVDTEVLEGQISHWLQKCFPADQASIITYCLSQLHKIGILPHEENESFVIEFDVIPYSCICKDLIFYARKPSKKSKKMSKQTFKAFRLVSGEPSSQSTEELLTFSSQATELYHLRESAERALTKAVDRSYLKDRLVDLLCMGDDRIALDSYPILLLSSPDPNIDCDSLKDRFSFINDVPWKVVIDFDSDAKLCTYMQEIEGQNMRILTVEEFDSNRDTAVKRGDSFLDELKLTRQIPWIFADGYDPLKLKVSADAHDWFKNRGQKGFREMLQFLNSSVPEYRAIVVFMILSGETETFKRGVCEVCSYFSDQYVILSELEDPSVSIQQELVRGSLTRDIATAKERSVIGIPWKDVNAVVKDLMGRLAKGDILIPTSTATCILTEKMKNEWTDLDIIGANECDREVHITEDNEARNKKRIEVEESFYRGIEVNWWNFWFRSQVMPRQIHETLIGKIKKALQGTLPEMDDDVTGRITLYHQPGAGGTTSAKNVLWDLRKKYRCAVVTNISETTAEQIFEFRNHGETPDTAKGVLLLLDNIDEEKVVNLISVVDQKAKELSHQEMRKMNRKHASDISVVFLLCKRAFERPKYSYGTTLMLKQELQSSEQSWLRTTHERLERTFHEKQGPDPRYLISFNVLRQGFNSVQIQKTVNQLVLDIKSPLEKSMLKYLALLNRFDLHHRHIPVAVFDNLMYDAVLTKQKERRVGWGYGRLVTVPGRWELRMSHTANILLNESSRTSFGQVKTVGIIHPVLSKELLSVLATEKNQSIGEVATEFLECKLIFGPSNCAKEALLKILKDIFIQRNRDPEGRPMTKFSSLIEEISKHEGPEIALSIFESGYNLTQDPFVAQQIARFYISMKNWEKAAFFAQESTSKKPENSYLWDTYAQVYREQLHERYKTLVEENRPISAEEAIEIVITAHKAMELFRKEQSVSEKETTSPSTNDAGFFGEIRTFLKLMGCLVYLDVFILENRSSSKDTLRKFIMHPRYVPENKELDAWEHIHGFNYIQILKNMWRAVLQTLNRLEDENVQLRESYTDDHVLSQRAKRNRDIENIKTEFDSYFGEDSDEIPKELEGEELYSFHRRRVKTIAGISLGDFFDLAGHDDGEKKLLKLLQYLRTNVESETAIADDYRMVLTVVFALLKFEGKYLHIIPYPRVIEWSKKLYESREKLDFVVLEPYLFYTMLNWPRKDTRYCVSPPLLIDALKQWKLAYWKKYPRQREEEKRHRKMETVMFFFANGSNLASLANYEEMRNYEETKIKASQFWRKPFVFRKLARFQGTLHEDGDQVSLHVPFNGNIYDVEIPTSLPKRDPRMLKKRVNFVIGFSWAGPKAYDVDLKDPTEDVSLVAEGHTVPNPKLPAVRPYYQPQGYHTQTQWEFMKQLQKTRDEIMSLDHTGTQRRLTEKEVSGHLDLNFMCKIKK